MSRKRARQVTTQFHKLTRQREAAQQSNDEQALQSLDQEISVMGGRETYQKASQVSTSFHSTSKWVLAHLSRNGWIYGVPSGNTESPLAAAAVPKKATKKAPPRRPTRILEVGAINTELLDAADATTGGRLLQVRAVDLHAMDRRIEQADFLQLPISHGHLEERYDVIVCSMVLNCVPTAIQRGEMVRERTPDPCPKRMTPALCHMNDDSLLTLTLL
jgi:25S rRNA (adenine2142-N1)-methyltransferase